MALTGDLHAAWGRTSIVILDVLYGIGVACSANIGAADWGIEATSDRGKTL